LKVTNGGVLADELITVIKNSLESADVSSSADLQVASVQLILRVVATTTAGGGLSFRVPVLGMQMRLSAKSTRQDTHILDITLKPPARQTGRELRDGDVEEVLVEAITTLRAVITRAAEDPDPWILEVGIVDITFSVTDEGTISLGFEGELANELTHTLRLGLTAN
jgi:Trypsin-co-occurring domain 2